MLRETAWGVETRGRAEKLSARYRESCSLLEALRPRKDHDWQSGLTERILKDQLKVRLFRSPRRVDYCMTQKSL